MQMAKGLDTGDMLLKKEVPIEAKETGESLHDKLMAAGAELIVEALPKIERGELQPEKQEEALSCYAPRLNKAMGLIQWNQDALSIERLVRGLNSWPSAYTVYKGKNLKIWEAEVIPGEEAQPAGTVFRVAKDFFDVAAGNGALRIRSLQLEGKKRMTVKDFLLGYEVKSGLKLG
jgi:methionyl-tRNA formyltransferase